MMGRFRTEIETFVILPAYEVNAWAYSVVTIPWWKNGATLGNECQ